MSEPRQARQTQADKSAAMQRRLCEATLETLAEVGYEKLSTTLVCEKAGVSRGAMTHHFSSRNALFAAAFAHLLAKWRDERKAYYDAMPPGVTISLAEQTEYLWQHVFGTPTYVASLELMLAARMDVELGQLLRDILGEWRDLRDARLIGALGGDPDDPVSLQFIRLNSCMLRGIAVHMAFDKSEEERETLLASWRDFLRANDDRLPWNLPGVMA
ncbi:TetR/AcrR family transcriptional regulator [Pseudooceanicola sp. CBS1P-1]|uniref:TetR family transcriptional regulator n=1 Tax=Pseudooceanicola albus TaxID=2692189 RepID=A0A6L7GB46_9RHOB|nr:MULTISPECIES: TetR/AcrR family transcriptional regulator [Pseudooceanicola]MBT9386466.1 TetR/AcrR family transcriptional regulator [Pseudooceanicola endophyticus]MXN20500.1 TetR family transcriptional regulator [Pseudooceanicola albus]